MRHDLKADIKKLRKSVFKIGVQKDGELTDISLLHLERAFGVKCHRYRKSEKILSFIVETSDGLASIHFLRNLDLGLMVANGVLDTAIIGTDMIEEYVLNRKVLQLKVIGDEAWSFHYLTARDRPVGIKDALIVGTSYPRIAASVLKKVGNKNAQIWKVSGSSELLPLLSLGNINIDGVLDISVSGQSARVNGLKCIGRAYRKFKPVLIGNYTSMNDSAKINFFKKI